MPGKRCPHCSGSTPPWVSPGQWHPSHVEQGGEGDAIPPLRGSKGDASPRRYKGDAASSKGEASPSRTKGVASSSKGVAAPVRSKGDASPRRSKGDADSPGKILAMYFGPDSLQDFELIPLCSRAVPGVPSPHRSSRTPPWAPPWFMVQGVKFRFQGLELGIMVECSGFIVEG